MIKIFFCLHRRPELSREEFLNYWGQSHGPLAVKASKITGLKRYIQNWTIRSDLGVAAAAMRGTLTEFDGVAESWIEESERQTAMSSESGQKLLEHIFADERKFIDMDRSVFFTVEEHVMIA
jgi:uncharacterized protein (TIGR02118 family)